MKKIKKPSRLVFMIFIYMFLAVGTVISLFPFFWQIRSSLMSNTEIFIFPPRLIPRVVKWGNYPDVFESFDFVMYLTNTLKILVPSFFGIVLTSYMSAYSFARLKFPGKNLWFSLAIATMLLPGIVTLLPTYVVWSKLGFVNTYVPLILPAWLGGGAANIFLLRQFFKGIPMSIDESARIDGAGHLRIMFQLLLPAMRPAVITISLFAFMGIWNDYFGPLIYLNDETKFTLALGLIQFQGTYASNWNLLMAASTLMILPVLIVFFIGQKYFIEGITFTGLKG